MNEAPITKPSPKSVPQATTTDKLSPELMREEFSRATNERRWVRMAVLGCLLVSAAATLLLDKGLWRAVDDGRIPDWAPMTAPTLFTLFVALYVMDRYLQVRRGKYPLNRAIIQIGLALAFWSLLWPSQAAQFKAHRQHRQQAASHQQQFKPSSALPNLSAEEALFEHDDAVVRAAACELFSYRFLRLKNVSKDTPKDQIGVKEILRLATHDPHPKVRNACRLAAKRLE